MVSKSKKIFILFSIIFLVLFFLFSFALVEAKLEVNYPEVFGQKITSGTTLPQYVKYIFNFSVMISGLVFFGVLIWGGVVYLSSAGNPVRMKEAKEGIGSAVLGIIILLFGYLILTTINPQLAILTLPPLKKIGGKYISNPAEYAPNKLSAIVHEIPVGNLTINLFEQEIKQKNKKVKAVNLLQATIISFKNFLNEKTKIDSEEFSKISNLNKYLKSLSEDCHCAEAEAICQKPKNFSFPVGCLGDPCKKVRGKIDNVLDKNNEKWKTLLAYKKKFNEIKDAFEDEARKFRQSMEILENCKSRELLNRREFYDNLSLMEKQKGEVKIIQSHIPAKTDSLTFYCTVGGTIFDYPYLPQEEIPSFEEDYISSLFEGEAPLSCPIYIPVGEAIIDPATEISYKINRDLEDVVYYIEKMTAGISKMEELISRCNKQHCRVNCSCVPPNPCFGCCSPIPCTFCVPFCKSPCLQTAGGCFGEPCGEEGRKEIGEMSQRIRIYENEIFSLLDELQGYIQNSEFILKGKVKKRENPYGLEAIKGGVQTCMALGPKQDFLKSSPEEPFWKMVNCEMAVGNKGPDGKAIENCNPQSFYCCSSKPLDQSRFASSLLSLPSYYNFSYSPKKPYKFSEYGYNKVPYFSQNDIRWKNRYFGCGTTIGLAGSAPASLAMALNYFKIRTDPITVAVLILDKDYRNCEKGLEDGSICELIKILGKGALKCEKKGVPEILNGLKNNKIAIVKTRSIPPYPRGGHYIVLTGIKERWGENFIYYNDPSYDITLIQQGKKYFNKPSDWLEKKGILEGYLISK